MQEELPDNKRRSVNSLYARMGSDAWYDRFLLEEAVTKGSFLEQKNYCILGKFIWINSVDVIEPPTQRRLHFLWGPARLDVSLSCSD